MGIDMRIGIICNHHFGIPAITNLLNNNLISGIAGPNINNQISTNLKLIADSQNLFFQFLDKQNLVLELKNWLQKINADVVFVFSFPYKIPSEILDLPKQGFVNFHPSVLPLYRGPDPLFWQIKNGEKETGITAHKMDSNFDTGPIIHIEKENINPEDNYGYLENKLSITLLKCVIKVTTLMMENNFMEFKYESRDEKAASYFGKPTENDLVINWETMSADSIRNLARAANPKYSGAIAFFKNIPLRIIQATISREDTSDKRPGTIVDSKNKLAIKTVDNKTISLDIIYTMEGCYTGGLFQKLFGLKADEKFDIQK